MSVRRDMPHVLVTGAAGAIGAAFARAYLARHPGARFSLVDIDLEGAQRVARELGADTLAQRWDLSEPSTLPDRVHDISAARGPVDVLVNCAGIMEVRSFAATPWSLGSRLLRVDLESPLLLMSLVVPSMVERRFGTVVNVSSMAGQTQIRGSTYYAAAKAGLALASEIARRELASAGVHVLTVYPGPVRSELERRARAQVPETAVTRLLPTGDPTTLGQLIVEACERRRARVIYPAFYDVMSRFPNLVANVTGFLSPMPTDRAS